MTSVAAQQGSAKSFTTIMSEYAMPARMWRHGIHSFLELPRHREQIRDPSKAALGPAGSQDCMRVWGRRSQANSTSGVPWLESCVGERFHIIHRQVPYLVSYSFVRLRRGSAWLTLRLLRGASGKQLSQEKRARTGAGDRLQDFEQDIDLEFVISDRAGSRERQESQIERAVDAVMLVDQLIPGSEGTVGVEAQPDDGQTDDLRGAGSQFSG
ncbi:hypothetical protein CFIO01_07087 [Colletotrichum fioriniae PJ7]|uniref:Uncharacterized protein n=1 Tax=Colletotrichum fioriniae PJ7 TaxID=1445577 RepID=A0A010R5I8_9PEZI|nr:hypothetical protein CFIO01_07087 [Colletotrichum fioriniae PJ7]